MSNFDQDDDCTALNNLLEIAAGGGTPGSDAGGLNLESNNSSSATNSRNLPITELV